MTVATVYLSGTKIYVYWDKKININESVVTLTNHLSELDPIYIGTIFSKYYPKNYTLIPIVKHTLRFYPIIGQTLLAGGCIFVQNHNRKPNKNQHIYIKNKLVSNNGNKKNVMIFPEGATYDKNIKIRREKYVTEHDYKTVMPPKTTGYSLIMENCGKIKKNIYLSMKFVNGKGNEEISNEYNLIGMLKGVVPKEVHIHMREVDVSKYNCREEYKNSLYNEFKKVDNTVSTETKEWKNKYKCEELTVNYWDIGIFLFCIAQIYTMFYLLITSGLYTIYFICGYSFYTYMGFRECRYGKSRWETVFQQS